MDSVYKMFNVDGYNGSKFLVNAIWHKFNLKTAHSDYRRVQTTQLLIHPIHVMYVFL